MKKKQKSVAINAVYLTRRYQGSGFHTYLLEILKSLEKIPRLCHYTLFTPGDLACESEQLSKFKTEIIRQKNFNFTDDLVQHAKFLKNRHESSYDLLFLPHLELPKKKSIPKKLILIPLVHDFIPTLFLTPPYLLTGKTPYRMLTSRGIKDFLLLKRRSPDLRKILTVSQATRDSLIKIMGKSIENKLTITPPGKSSRFRKQTPRKCDPTLRKYHLNWKRYLIYFGGYTARKNTDRMIEAFKLVKKTSHIRTALPDLKLVLVDGAGKKIRDLPPNLSPYLILLPKLTNEELNQIINGSIYSLYPSLYEGFGLPLVESIQAGILPITSNNPSSREILTPQYPLFNPYRIRSIHQTIIDFLLEYLEHPSHIESWTRSLQKSLTRYSWDKSATRLDQLFSDLIQ